MRDFLLILALATATSSFIPVLFILLPMFIVWDVSIVSAAYVRGCIAVWLIISLFVSVYTFISIRGVEHHDV